MTITLCNSHPFTFYLPFHTSLRADQCPIHVPSTCTLGLDPCARHSLFGRTDPYYIDNFYSSCGLKRLAATLGSPLLCNCTVLPVPLSTGPYLDRQYNTLPFRPLRPLKWSLQSHVICIKEKVVSSNDFRVKYENFNYAWLSITRILDDQTQVDSKPAGQPEHAGLNQCQLKAANRPKLMLWAPPAGGGNKVSLYCNQWESWLVLVPTWPRADALSGTPGMSPARNYPHIHLCWQAPLFVKRYT